MNEEEKGFEEELASKFITGLIMTSEYNDKAGSWQANFWFCQTSHAADRLSSRLPWLLEAAYSSLAARSPGIYRVFNHSSEH